MGAPPSRTNTAGQPWGFAVLDPEQMWNDDDPGAGARFMAARVASALADCDGLRIDHPHGLVYPWVYRADAGDPVAAVQAGARLNASPDLADHPHLAPHALVTPDQIDRTQARHADGWVRRLNDEQVARFARLLDHMLAGAQATGVAPRDVACEVLSTWPYPLRRVMQARGLGRFVVTQKTNPDDPHDRYRRADAEPQDWIMIGNHDTVPLWSLVSDPDRRAWRQRRARYMAEMHASDPDEVAALAAVLTDDDTRFCEAMFAELFLGPAANVSIFFADLLGTRDAYNRVGIVHPDNWSLRVPPTYRELYAQRRRAGRAAHLPRALALALQARMRAGDVKSADAAPLVEKLRKVD